VSLPVTRKWRKAKGTAKQISANMILPARRKCALMRSAANEYKTMRINMGKALEANGSGIRENIAGGRYYTIGAALGRRPPNAATLARMPRADPG
jgi:hypothetical protein